MTFKRHPKLVSSVTGIIIFLITSVGDPSFAVSPAPNPQPPRAACRIEIDNAHISSTLYKHLNRKFVKVNAVSICNIPHSRVTLTVKIYKVGLLVDHFVSFSATNPSAQSSSGYRVVNQGTKAICKSGKMSN